MATAASAAHTKINSVYCASVFVSDYVEQSVFPVRACKQTAAWLLLRKSWNGKHGIENGDEKRMQQNSSARGWIANNTNQEYFWNFTEKSAHSMKYINCVWTFEARKKKKLWIVTGKERKWNGMVLLFKCSSVCSFPFGHFKTKSLLIDRRMTFIPNSIE